MRQRRLQPRAAGPPADAAGRRRMMQDEMIERPPPAPIAIVTSGVASTVARGRADPREELLQSLPHALRPLLGQGGNVGEVVQLGVVGQEVVVVRLRQQRQVGGGGGGGGGHALLYLY